MNIWQRFKRLNLWNKVSVVGAVCSILAFACWLLLCDAGTQVDVKVEDSPRANVQTAVNSPGATQVIADQVVLIVAPKLERKLTMSPVHLNKPAGNKFESLFQGRLEAPYPIPGLRVVVHGQTVEEVDLSPMRTGLVMHGHSGKREGYVFTTLQNAIGRLQLKVISRRAEKLRIVFSAEE